MDRLVKSNQIISKKYSNFKEFVKKNKKKYIIAEPFPHIVLDNFFKTEYLSKIVKNFPNLSTLNKTQKYSNKNEVKLANNNTQYYPAEIKSLVNFLNSKKFIMFLQDLTSIKEKLVADKYLSGGGLHEIKKGGVLKVHTDFNKHPFLKLDRRLNLLLYLNKKWSKNYGGNLEFWDKDMKKCRKKVLPIFNRMVIFSTTDFSNHGHPVALKCPKNRSRKSIATYYFSKGRPKYEVKNSFEKNTTMFKNRAKIPNDVYIRNDKFKNFLRSFKFYQNLKNFEKKYLRNGMSKKKRFEKY